MSTDDNMLRETLEGTRDSLSELWARIDADDNGEGSEYYEPRDELDDRPLEIVWRKGSPFSVLLTFGGPNIWIECDARYDVYTLRGAWGGETDELHGDSITRTGEYFRELVDEGDER